MRIVVLGTTGQLATELHRGAATLGLALAPSAKVDISIRSELEALLDAQQPALVLNAAAYTAVDKAESDAEHAFAVNAEGPRYAAEWCARRGAALVHVSTDYVFDGTKTGAYAEDDAPAPVGVYGASKLAGERAVAAALGEHVIVRTSWVYSAIGQNFVKTMLRLSRERDELRVVDDQLGKPTSGAELAGAVLGIAAAMRARRASVPWGLYHFAGSTSLSWCGFAKAIVEEQAPFTGRRPTVTPISTADYPTPAKRPANSILNTSRFEAAFGIAPRVSHEELRQVVRELNTP